MKYLAILLLLLSFPWVGLMAAEEDRAANTVILDELGVKNLRLQTVMVEERDFEQTIFAIGRVEEIPGNRWAVSSRIPGRAIEVNAFLGDRVKEGQVLARVESRQPGNPPPTIDLRAPHDGLVIGSHVLKGQPVQPDQDLMDISDRSAMWVVARIPEQLARGIKPGTRARIRFPALGGDPLEAELERFGVEADRDAGAIDGIFVIENRDSRLVPGMRAELDLVVSIRKNVLAVPEGSIQGDPASRVIYVKDFELQNAFVRAPVVVGEKGGGWVEITQGVFPGDEVVTRGAYSLGFVGGGSGMSLKEALDAAHGHEHAEDGSELTPEQKAAAKQGHTDDSRAHTSHSGASGWVAYYAAGATLLLIWFAQAWWNLKRRKGANHA